MRLNKAPLNSVTIPGYNFEFTATESSNGAIAIYIKKGLNYKLRKDPEIYKSKQLESTFIEANLKNEKVVIGCIYRHPWNFQNSITTTLQTSWILFLQKLKLVLLGDLCRLMQIYLSMTKIAAFQIFTT